MTTKGLSQKEYLKRYLSGGSDDKKTKKRKLKCAVPSVNRLRIVDDDIDVKSMRPLEEDELELCNLQEDAPQIAGVIDERPEEVKNQDKFASKKWKVIVDENDIGVKIIDKTNVKSESNGQDVQVSLSHSTKNHIKVPENSIPKLQVVDVSPPRRNKENSDCERDIVKRIKKEKSVSPQRNESCDTDISPPRRQRKSNIDEHYNCNSGVISDYRIGKKCDRDISSQKRDSNLYSPLSSFKKRRCGETDVAPSRRTRNETESDESPPRKLQREYETACTKDMENYNSDDSTTLKDRRRESAKVIRKSGRDVDSDESPQRKNRKQSPPRKNTKKYDSNESPVRYSHPRYKTSENCSPKKDQRSDSDASPPRKIKTKHSESPRRHKKNDELGEKVQNNSWRDGGDHLRNRRKVARCHKSVSPKFKSHNSHRENSERSESEKEMEPKENSNGSLSRSTKETSKKMTMDGRKAGLVGASELKAEIADMKHKEKELFENMDHSVSGRGVAAIVRDRKTGKCRDLEQEEKEKKKKNEKEAEREAKYVQWGKGLKQVTDQNEKLQQDLYEMTKPLARYADDTDLDKYLREQEREGDPMLNYIRNKSKDTDEKGKPQYEGTFMPNRFGIRPGYRWDGVDRSNGYEKQWFEEQNSKKAVVEEAYKWSTSDM